MATAESIVTDPSTATGPRLGINGKPPIAARDRVVRLLDRLEDTDLTPGPHVDPLFTELVRIAESVAVDDPQLPGLLADPTLLERSRDLCSRGETRLEQHWARRVAARRAELGEFPYLRNYGDLTHGEIRAVASVAPRLPTRPRVLVAGCGPLPLTALLLARAVPDVTITCLDDDPEAVELARTVIAVHRHVDIDVVESDARDMDYGAFDVVVLAALVGRDPADKRRVLDRVTATAGPGTLVAARSVPADGRLLLYRRLGASELPRGLAVLAENPPAAGVINSTVLAARRGGSWDV